MEIRKFISQFGAKVGIENLALDHESRCNLLFNDIAVSLEVNFHQQSLFVYSYLADVPKKSKNNLNMQIAYSNCRMKNTKGMTVGVERESGKTVLVQTVNLRGLQLDRFLEVVERFIKNAEHWTKAIKYFSPSRPLEVNTEEEKEVRSLTQEDAPPMGMKV